MKVITKTELRFLSHMLTMNSGVVNAIIFGIVACLHFNECIPKVTILCNKRIDLVLF